MWVGDLAPEHKLAPAWQPALAWLDSLTLPLALDPGDGTALQAAALADLDARRDEAGGPGRPAPPAGRPGQGPRQGGRRPQGAAPVGVAVRAGPACRSAVAEVVAAFPPLLPATAKGERPGAPAGPAAMCRQKGRLPWTQGRQPAHDALCVRVCIACCALRAFLASVPCGAATGMNESTGTQRQAPYQREQSRQSRLLRCGPAQVHA